MNKLALLFLFLYLLSTGRPAHGTSCVYAEFRTTHVDLLYCENHGRWNFTELLRQKGLIRVLDHYVASTGLEEKLAPKRVKVTVYSSVFGAEVVYGFREDMSSFNIQVRGAVDPELLLRTVDYFATPDPRPFPAEGSDPYSRSDASILEEVESLLGGATASQDSARALSLNRRFVVMNLGELLVVYRAGELTYELSGVTLPEPVSDPIPIRVVDRYYLGDGQGISVYEGGKVVARTNWERQKSMPPYYSNVSGHGAFVDFYDGDRVALIYSNSTDTFHQISADDPRGWPRGRDAASCERFRANCIALAAKRIGFFASSE